MVGHQLAGLLVPEHDGDPVHAHDLEGHVDHRAKQPVEVELGGELLGDLEQHLELEGLARLAAACASTRSWPAGGPSRLVMPGGTPPLTDELADDLPAGGAGLRGDGGALDDAAGRPAHRQPERPPCRR